VRTDRTKAIRTSARRGTRELHRGEVALVLFLQHFSICPAAASRVGLHEFPIAKDSHGRRMLFRVGTVQDGAEDVEAGMSARYASGIKTSPTMGEDHPRARSLGEQLPANAAQGGSLRVPEPPSVLEDPRRFPTRDFAMNVHANVVMVLHHAAPYARLNVDAGAEPCPDVVRFRQHRPDACRRVLDVALEGYFESVGHPSCNSKRSHGLHPPSHSLIDCAYR